MNHRRPTPIRRLLRALVLVLAGTAVLTLALGSAHPTSEAWAASDHQAMVVIDYSSHVDTYVVHFASDSITAEQALNLTGVSVVYQPYGGMGDAICKIQQVGCNAGQGCLDCDPNGKYWAYSYAEAGSSHFTTSPKGVSSTPVTDGDEEGFKWGTGQSPQYVPFGSSAPPPSTTTTTVAAGPASSSGGGAGAPAKATTQTTSGGSAASSPASGGAGTAAAGATSTVAPAPGVAADATDGGGSTFTVPSTGDATGSAQQLAAPARVRRASSGGGSALPGLIAFAVVIAALAGAGLLVRRRTRAADPAS